jgi:transcriptional regulator with PAS, ATPase and Fis domain
MPIADGLATIAQFTTETVVGTIQTIGSGNPNKPISNSGGAALLDYIRRSSLAVQLESKLFVTSSFEGMIGDSPLMVELFAHMQAVAPSYRSALISGATGTGKDLVARGLHNLNPVTSGRFVSCNCSAVVETLFESELFGYVKGAFTGATADKMGLIEYAHGGTLFLDENRRHATEHPG